VISDVGPEVTLETPALSLRTQHRDIRVIGPHDLRLKNPLTLEIIQGLKEASRGFDPVTQRASRQIHPVTCENVFQAIEWKVIGELADDDLRD